MITHKLDEDILKKFDEIIVMKNGKIVADGSPEELMALNGKYAYMFRLQAEKYSEQ